MNKNALKEIVEGIVEAADELLEKEDRDLVEQGELIAYAESLSIIRDACAGYDLKEIGLDFAIDAKYLN
ncbi:MAG: hypothetical protein IKT52_13790 [Oscillospiraceae bacterium]|nr:hypothetical protein [Oscillospiraceae bacterium]